MSTPAPLAEQLRPGSLEELIGQGRILDQIRPLLQGNRLPSLLFFGPPGCGKSSLAILLARSFDRTWLRLSAPETGLSALRKKIAETDILILDEIHRFSKAQQDFFLPLLETGKITLLATTTENPSFHLTKQLLSRLHVLRLKPLSPKDLTRLAGKGLDRLGLSLPEDSLEMLVKASQGDARTLLNLLEYAAELPAEDRGREKLTSKLPQVMQRSDKQGDSHYELASALIKSIRGSDPDAALYYLAGMLEGGEDPRFICRRLILSASEDIGLADPSALTLAVSCLQAVELTGMPEGFIPLAETVTYLALSPKSNSTYAAYLAAQKEIRENGLRTVPFHLRNPSTTLHKQWGYGKGYKYPHAFPGSWIQQDYLPEGLENRTFYSPKDQGMEQKLNLWLKGKLRKKPGKPK
ncbi:MAG: replication-associated recombination protein A [Desulfohalobiaceae bacterium]|nr:replication-associated recombination protein A [Desulfohalobiaceae bacterium]